MTAIQPIDKLFLEDALKEPIKDFEVGEGCKAGDNVAGSLKSISVTTVSGKKVHLVFKAFPEHLTQENGFVVFMKAFWREHSIYKIVFPKLEQFAKSHGLEYTAPIPKYYKGHNDDKNDYILLQDVRPDGYKMPNKLVSLTAEETALTLKEFARLHAIGYAFLRQEGNRIFTEEDGFQFLVQPQEMKDMMEDQFDEMLRLFYSVAASVLDTRFPEGAARMRKHLKNVGKLHNTMEHLTDSEIFPTICHFDLWCNNMLIRKNPEGKSDGVKFIDFQFMQRGNVFTDLHYFLYTSTSPDFRKKHLNEVLNLYYDEFSTTLEKMNTPLPWGFTRGFFIDTFLGGLDSAFARMTFAIPLQLGMISKTEQKEGGPLHTEEGIKKMYDDSPAAVDRLESLVKEMIELKVFK